MAVPDRDELAAIFHSLGMGVFTVDLDGKVGLWSRAAETITGYAARDIVGTRCDELEALLCPTGGREGVRCPLLEDAEDQECALRRRDGRRVRVLRTVRKLLDPSGRVLGGVGAFIDLSPILALERRVAALEGEIERRFSFEGIVGKSAVLQEVYRLIERAAATDVTCLLLGESGTGKELAARAIHARSPRRAAPFVAVHASALPETLVESELFGHVKGAFTGASSDRTGRIEAAEGGTLFLDEIGELAPSVQVKLLRFLQERTFERVGETEIRRADVRVVAATNRDLAARMREGAFREDLYFRVKVFPIRMPPLRERREDIPLLVSHFIGIYNERYGRSVPGIAPEALKVLMDHSWPGNIRELENAIEHAFVICGNATISAEDLPADILDGSARLRSPAEPAADDRGARERAELVDALERAGWNRTEAARRLGVSRATVWARMRKHGIRPPD
ncbi:MAG: sigma 54-interacting transcriptional regulator [Planctomycetes bacterium]|nr:sigma 54-interacting transcriptional regulator [Planctomycetota bacterium]